MNTENEQAYFDMIDRQYCESVVQRAGELRLRGKLNQGISLMELLIKDIRPNEQAERGRYSFRNTFEELMFVDVENKEAEWAELPYSLIYVQYGNLLFSAGRFEEAKKALATASKWNPTDVMIQLELAEAYKATDDIGLFYNITISASKFVYEDKSLACILRNAGYYFIEMNMYDIAAGCEYLSLEFYDDDMPRKELEYIASRIGRKPPVSSHEKMVEYSERFGFPIEHNQKTIAFALECARFFEANLNWGNAAFFYRYAYGMTKSKDILEQAKRCERHG